MKKLLQTIFSYKNIIVTDADTGIKENAQYQMILGFPVRVKYTPCSINQSNKILRAMENSQFALK
jgi:hypothetical protein